MVTYNQSRPMDTSSTIGGRHTIQYQGFNVIPKALFWIARVVNLHDALTDEETQSEREELRIFKKPRTHRLCHLHEVGCETMASMITRWAMTMQERGVGCY